jgi:hypothetical protein
MAALQQNPSCAHAKMQHLDNFSHPVLTLTNTCWMCVRLPTLSPAVCLQSVPQLRTTANIRLFNAEMKQCDYNLQK